MANDPRNSTKVKPAIPDRLTIIAIAVIAYSGLYISHEIIGHCGMAGLLGVKCTVISSTYIPLIKEYSEIPTSTYNIILVAGSATNLMMALICFVLPQTLRTTAPARYFLWLFMAINLFLVFGYMTVAPVIKVGDAYYLIYKLPNQIFWRVLVVIAGAAGCMLSFWLCLRELKKLIGEENATRLRAWRLTVPAYLAGGVIVVTSGLFSQGDFKWVQIQAAGGTFGLTAWLLLLPLLFPNKLSNEEYSLITRRSRGWIVAGALIGLVFVIVLGPGVAV